MTIIYSHIHVTKNDDISSVSLLMHALELDSGKNDILYPVFLLMCLQGCPSPIVVKFADTEKEKLQKKMQQMVTLGGMGMNIGLGMGFPYFQHSNYNAACQQVRSHIIVEIAVWLLVLSFEAVSKVTICLKNDTPCNRNLNFF